MDITKTTLIADILRKHPGSAKVFDKYKMGCASCMGMQNETVEKASLMHGIDMEALVEDLKKAAK